MTCASTFTHWNVFWSIHSVPCIPVRTSLSRSGGAATGQNHNLLPSIENVGGTFNVGAIRKACTARVCIRRVVWNVTTRSLLLLNLFFLNVNGETDMSHSVIRKGGPTCQVGNVLHMRWPHDAFVEDRDIHEKLVERQILLGKCTDEIVKLKTCDRQYRLSV